MMIGHENGFAVGNDRYGSRQNEKYPCPACNKSFDEKSKFISHMKGTHGESGELAIARARGIEDPDFGKR